MSYFLSKQGIRSVVGTVGLGLLLLVSACQTRPPEESNGRRISDVGVIEEDSAPEPATLITPEGIGVAHLGLTFELLKQRLEAEFGTGLEYRPQLGLTPDWDAIAIVQSGQLLYYLLYPAGTALNATDPIHHLMTENPRFQTLEGVGTGMTVQEVAEHYGAAHVLEQANPLVQPSSETESATGDPERDGSLDGSLAVVEFEQQPDALVLRIRQGGDSLADSRIVAIELRQPATSNPLIRKSEPTQATVNDPAASNLSAASPAAPGTVTQALAASLPPTNQTSIPASVSPIVPSSSAVSSSKISERICQNPSSQKTLSQCAHQTLERSEALQQQLQDQLKKQFPQFQAALLKAHASWLDYRQADCDYTYRDRTDMAAYSTLVTACQTTLTEARIGELRSVLTPAAPESALSSPVPTPAPTSAEILAKPSDWTSVPTAVEPLSALIAAKESSAPGSASSASTPRSETPSFNLTMNCSVAQSGLTFSACTQANFQSVDQSLQAQTRSLIETLDPAERSQLRALQQTWRIFRQDHCAWKVQLLTNTQEPGAQKSGEQELGTQALEVQQQQLGQLNQCLTHQTEKRQSTLAAWQLDIDTSETLPKKHHR